jgi:phage-related protein
MPERRGIRQKRHDNNERRQAIGVKKVYIYISPDGNAPFLDFLRSLDTKQQKKLDYSLKCMVLNKSNLSEPQVKHFSIERYRQLYELREKAQVLLRVVFTLDEDGNIILLCPFIKRHKRNTNQALESSLKMLTNINQYPDSLREYKFS